MTTALVKDQPWSLDRARAGLVDRAVAAESTIAGRPVRVLPEPLLRRGEDGRMLQSIRLAGEGLDAVGEILVRSDGGAAEPVRRLAGPGGSVRILLPAVTETRRVSIEFPQLSAAESVTFDQIPVREWTIHLVQHSHYDIGYTDPQGTIQREHLNFLDSCVDLARASQDRPEPARFRWSVEALRPFEAWADSRPAARVEEFVDLVRAGQLELTALPYNVHLDTCSTDELHELLRLRSRLQRRYGVEIPVAMQTDVPGQPVGLPTALAQHGVKYLSVAHNWAGRSVPHLVGGRHLPRLFRWRAPSGESVLVWMTDTPHGLAYMEGASVGFTTSYEMVEDLLPAYLTAMATNSYPYPPGAFGWHGPAVTDREPYPWDVLHMRVLGRYSDNAPPSLIHSDIVRRWNETWAFPHLRLSTNADFFADAEARLGEEITTVTGDWGDWWVEGVGSAAHPQAMARHAQARLTDAQTVSGLARAIGGQGVPRERDRSDGVYTPLSLFDEHTWGASDPWTVSDAGRTSGEDQWHWKYAQALIARDEADLFLDSAAAHLGAGLAQAPDADAVYHAVNTTGAVRSGTVSLFVRESMIALDVPVEVRDARTGEVLPSREIPQTNPENRAAGRFVEVQVRDVPPAGAVRLTVHARSGVDAPGSAGSAGAARDEVARDEPAQDGAVLENEHLRVRVDLRRSTIASIVDKATGRELVDPDAVVGMNGYVYDTYTTAGGYNHQSNKTAVSEELELLGSRTLARPAALLSRSGDDLGDELTYEFPADGADWVRVRLRLPRGASHLEIENRLAKPATMTKESAFFAFPFATAQPRVRYEITGGVTGPDMPEVPGAPKHMRAVREWVTVEEEDLAVAWVSADVPLVHPEVISLPYAPFPESMAPRQPGTVYSWVHNNVWDTNFPVQQAFEATFRYAVGVRRAGEEISTPALAMRTAAALTRPLVGVLATGPTDPADTAGTAGTGSAALAEAAAPAEWSLLSLEDDRVRLVAVEEAGAGHLVKLQSFAEEPVRVRLRPGVPVTGAGLATYLGERTETLDVTDAGVEVPIPALGVVAVVLDAA